MDARHYVAARLPRLVVGRRAAPLCNAAGLIATSLVGATAVHVLAYHMPFGLPPGARWTNTALALLAHCPVRGLLGVVAIVAVALLALGLWELRRLERLSAALARYAEPSTSHQQAMPRSLPRLFRFIAVLLPAQVALTALMERLCPMHVSMLMGGVHMMMPLSPALPLGPLHLVVATALALLLWRVERRLIVLRARIAHRLCLLTGMRADSMCPPAPRGAVPLSTRHDPALFARPPPRSYQYAA